MFHWVEKFQAQKDWITLSFIVIFTLTVYLFRTNSQQFKLLFFFWNSKSYLKLYDKEKFTSLLNPFNLILTFIILFSFSLLGYFFYKKILLSLLGEISFVFIFLVISGMVITRYLILKLIFQVLDQIELFQQTIFRSLSFYGITSFYALIFFIIYYYRYFTNDELLLLINILTICSVYFSHLFIYFKITGVKPQNLIYLILYLCAFKLAPWLWLYKLIY